MEARAKAAAESVRSPAGRAEARVVAFVEVKAEAVLWAAEATAEAVVADAAAAAMAAAMEVAAMAMPVTSVAAMAAARS